MSNALAEALAEEKAIEADQQARANGTGGATADAPPPPPPVPLSIMLGKGTEITVGDCLLYLSPLVWEQLPEVEARINLLPPVLQGALLTFPRHGKGESDVDIPAVTAVLQVATGDENYSENQVRNSFRRLAFSLTPGHKNTICEIFLMALLERHPDLTIDVLVPGMSIPIAIAGIRRILSISGGLAEDFDEG
jgi:hypothetical protein